MAFKTIRIRSNSHKSLKEIAAMTGRSLQDELELAIEDHCRKFYIEGVNAHYVGLHRNPLAMADFKKDMNAWSATNRDGLGRI
jgi:hypothetical protein